MRVTLKLATSLDGRIATQSGESKWITGEAAREQVHRLRAEHDAILVGVETVIADDPALTVRLAGHTGAQPAAIVLDSRQRTPSTARLLRAPERTFVIAVEGSADRLESPVRVVKVRALGGRVDPAAALEALPREIGSVLIEGGGQVAASFIAAGLVDAIEWFRAPIVLGDEGRPAIGDFVLDRLADAPRYKRLEVISLGDDLWERYERA